MALTYLERSRPTQRGCTGACWELRSPGLGQFAAPSFHRASAHLSARKREDESQDVDVTRQTAGTQHKTATHLVLENKDEDVVRADGEHEERHHLQDDERGGDADPGVEAH